MPIAVPYTCNVELEGYPTTGFTFGVLGPVLPDGTYPVRYQGEDPVFTGDYSNNTFVTGTNYTFVGSHPQLVPEEQAMPVYFDEMGIPHFIGSPEENASPSNATTLGGLPVLLGTPVAGQNVGVVDVNGTKVISLTPAPTLDSVIANNSNSDRAHRLGPKLQRSPPLVNSIQRIRVTYFTGAEDIYAEADITYQQFLDLLRKEISLGDALGVNNKTRNVIVTGGRGTYKRTSTKDVTRLWGLLPSEIDGQPGDWDEPIEIKDVVIKGLQSASPTELALINTILNRTIQGFVATATGSRCPVEGTPAPTVQPAYRASITPGMVGTEQNHNLQTPGTGLFPILLNSDNQPEQGMVLTFPTINTYLISYPEGITDGYAGGKLKLELL